MNEAESLSGWEVQSAGKWGNWPHNLKERKPGKWWLEQNWRQNPGSPTGETGFQSRVSASACQGMCPQGRECPHSSEDKQPGRQDLGDVFVALRSFINYKFQIPKSPGPSGSHGFRWHFSPIPPCAPWAVTAGSLWPGKGLTTLCPAQSGLGATTGVLQASCSVFHCPSRRSSPKLEDSHPSASAEATQPPAPPQSRGWP